MDSSILKLISAPQVRKIHARVLFAGERRGEFENRLEAALGRIEQRIIYGIQFNDIFDVAGCYGAFISVAHAFVDGNKRTAFRTMDAFLSLHGLDLSFDAAPEDHILETLIECADQGRADEIVLSTRLRSRFLLLQA